MECVGVSCSQNVLAELECCERKFLRPLAVESLVLIREVSSTTDEALVVVFKKLELVLVQAEFILLLIDCLHPLEKVIVQRHIHRVLREHRRHLLGHCLHRVIGIGLHEVVEDTGNLVKGLAGVFHRLDSILECRLVRIGYNGVNLGLGLCNSCLESRKIMFVLDLVELRSTERCGRLSQKRILHVATADKCKRCACNK